jgi:hypothetical protein
VKALDVPDEPDAAQALPGQTGDGDGSAPPSAPSEATAPRPSGVRRFASLTWLAILGALVCVLASVWLTAVPLGLAGALFTGALLGVSAGTRRGATVTGAAAGALGGLLTILYADASLVGARLAHLPGYATADVTTGWFNAFVLQVMSFHVVNVYFAETLGRAAYPLFTAAVTAVVALAVAVVAGVDRKRLVVAVVTLLLCIAFTATAWSESATFRGRISSEPAVGTYNYDPYIYLRAYYLMGRGDDYYHALVTAAAGDSRLIHDRSVVNGKFVGWATSPAFVRLPTAFLLWRAVPGGTTGIVALSIALCALLLGAMAAVFEPLLGERALLVPLLAFPFLLGGTVWINIFLPDWWAALALLGSVLLLVRRDFLLAGVLALLAALFRETATLWLLVLFAGAVWFRLRGGRAWTKRAVAYGAMLAAFGVAWTLHYRAGTPLIAAVHVQRSVGSILSGSAARPFVQRFEQPAAYIMLPYGWYAYPASVFLLLQLGGFLGALRERPYVRALVLGFALSWMLATATIGGTSSYWGQLYMPTALVGTAALLARPDLLVAAFRRAPVTDADIVSAA